MRSASIVTALMMMLCHAAAGAEITQQAKQQLEGNWLLDQRPDKGPCISNPPGYGTQLEFEFLKSGGRIVVFEPYDLFTPIALADVEQRGSKLVFSVRPPHDQKAPTLQVEMLSGDRLELSWGEQKPTIAYRCGLPDRNVTGDVPAARLAVLTPPISGGQILEEVREGFSDAALCSGKSKRSGWLWFELLGPVRYWVVGQPGAAKVWRDYDFDLTRITSVKAIDPKALKLEIQGHDGKQFTLSAVEKPDGRVEIPELDSSFVRCDRSGHPRR